MYRQTISSASIATSHDRLAACRACRAGWASDMLVATSSKMQMNVTFGPISHNSSKLTCLTITQITSNSNRHSPKTLSCFHDFSGFSKVTLFLWKWTVPPREGGTDPGRYLSMLLIFLHNDPRVTYLPTLQYVSLRYY